MLDFTKRWFLVAALMSCASFAAQLPAQAASAEETPDALIKNLGTDLLNSIRADKEIQAGNTQKLLDLIDVKVLPHMNFQRTTALAVGRNWSRATPEQQKQLTQEFRKLLVYTYAGALTQLRDQTIQIKPFRADPADTEVVVRSLVLSPRADPIQLDYRLEKSATGWKVYDINVLGAWLVENYRTQFSNEISQNGIDGLIKKLVEMNRGLDKVAKK